MFTGIVEELGTVVAMDHHEGPDGVSARLVVAGPVVTSDAAQGASIAVNGVCLTVVDTDAAAQQRFSVDVMAESLSRSALARLAVGSRVNLERATPAGGRLGGHVVQGHVDGVGEVLVRTPGDGWETVRFALPSRLARYVAEKGSIAVDGVSLTVAAVSEPAAPEPWFEVGLIPTTLAATTLGSAPPGTPVNLEVDVLAKYVERIAAVSAAQSAPSAVGAA